MAFRDLVTGGAGCSAPGEQASSSNPLGSLADALLGSAAKTQERVRELPGLVAPGEGSSRDIFRRPLPGAALPGTELERGTGALPPGLARNFLDTFRAGDQQQQGFESAWNEAASQPRAAPAFGEAHFAEFDQIYDQGRQSHGMGPPVPAAVLPMLHSFLHSAQEGVPFHVPPTAALPPMVLSEADQSRIRNRSFILARQLFAEKGEAYADMQISSLLASLNIQEASLPPSMARIGPMGGRFTEFEDHWKEAIGPQNGRPMGGPHVAEGWASEFDQQHPPSSWADEFGAAAAGPGGEWASEFNSGFRQQMDGRESARDGRTLSDQQAAMTQAARLAEALTRDQDPKFQNSEFLKYVSKMSRGEVPLDASGAPQQQQGPSEDWAREFDQLHHNQPGPAAWADEFAASQNFGVPAAGAAQWADEFGSGLAQGLSEDAEGDEAQQKEWLDSYDSFVQEQLRSEQELRASSSSSRWMYQFADVNPYVGHAAPFAEAQDLFHKGLLSEAVLALEAEVLKSPENAVAWKLLGTTHAENDDDRQAIAAMARARDADPTNLDVLLSLGVSHTNELEQDEALSHIHSWVQNHPIYRQATLPESSARLRASELVDVFTEAARSEPGARDPEVHTVLGVLFNLTRDYEAAKSAFRTALELRPDDYSLWNKLGATQANSAQSTEAIEAYQKALDLKPNYVRAWCNMGIGYANQGRYDDSVPYYVRALTMNPKADNAWQYLRISLSCAGRSDMVDACDARDLDRLSAEFPL